MYKVHKALYRRPRWRRESSCDCDLEILVASADKVFSKEAGELSSLCACQLLLDSTEYVLTFQGQRETILSSDFRLSWVSPCHVVVMLMEKMTRQTEQITPIQGLPAGGRQLFPAQGTGHFTRELGPNLADDRASDAADRPNFILARSRSYFHFSHWKLSGNYDVFFLIGILRFIISI